MDALCPEVDACGRTARTLRQAALLFGHVFAGVEIKSGGDPVIRRCQIHHQPSHNGVMVWEGGRGTLPRAVKVQMRPNPLAK